MGTTAAYAWLRTRAAAAGASPARDSLRSSSTGRLPLLARTQRSDVTSALRNVENIIQTWEEWTLCYLADVILVTLQMFPTHSTSIEDNASPALQRGLPTVGATAYVYMLLLAMWPHTNSGILTAGWW